MSHQTGTAPLKIAVVGAGLIGRRHVESVLADPATTLSAVVDPSEATRDFAASKNAAWFATFAEAAENERPDGVIVATPNRLHAKIARQAIERQIPVLVEKPICDDAGVAASLVEDAEKANVPILVGHHRRHNPVIQAAKRLLEGGRLGTVLAAHGTFWVAKPDDYFDAVWRRETGGGPTLINLIHEVDLFRYFFGDVESVHAMESNAARKFPVEDTCVVLIRFKSGVLATLNASDAVVSPWSWEMTAGENPAFPQEDQLCYQIGGTRGSLAIPRSTLWTSASTPNWMERLVKEQIPLNPSDPLFIQLRHFCDVIRGNAIPLISGHDGLATLRVIDAIKASARSSQTMFLSDAPPERGFAK